MGIELLLILSIAVVLYTYAGYPALAYVLSRWFGRPIYKADITPRVAVIIAAYNEERDIARKLENTLELDYPRDRLEILVASDCSSDRTDEIVREYSARGVVLHRLPERLGKSVAQNRAARTCAGEVLVFSDATTMYEPDAVRKIVRSFADPQVGCVAGELIYVDPGATAVGQGCRSYWSYEKLLKRSESRLGSLIGVSGCLYAVRRSNFSPIPLDMSSDFAIATEIHLQGLRTVYDHEAIAFEETNGRDRDEFRMRIRVIEQTMSALHRYAEVLDPRRHGLFAFQMISHKVLRYALPLFLIVAFISSAMLVDSSSLYRLIFVAQAMFYATALAGWACERMGLRIGPLSLPYYFVLANAASLAAFVKFVRGEAHLTWEPLRESSNEASETSIPVGTSSLLREHSS